jgi:hypothetical protein
LVLPFSLSATIEISGSRVRAHQSRPFGQRGHPIRCTLRCSRRLIVSDATSTSR